MCAHASMSIAAHTRTAARTNTHIDTHTHTKTSVCGFPLWASNHTLSSFCRGFSFLLSLVFRVLPGTLFQTHMLMFLQDLDTHTHTHTHTHRASTLHVERPSPGWPTCWPRQAAMQGGADGEPGPAPYDFNCCLHWTFTDGDTNINMLTLRLFHPTSGAVLKFFIKYIWLKLSACLCVCASVSAQRSKLYIIRVHSKTFWSRLQIISCEKRQSINFWHLTLTFDCGTSPFGNTS